VVAVLAACGAGEGSTAAPCDLLRPDDVAAVVGDGLEPVHLEGADAEAACIYAPPGTKAGDEPSKVAAIQVEKGRFKSAEQLLKQGKRLDGVGDAAIIETEDNGFTIVVLTDEDEATSFGLVVRGDVQRDEVADLARRIAERSD